MGDSTETKKLDDQVAELKEWVSNQPHVAKDMDDHLLTRFLHSCYYDMEKTQKTLETFTSLRTSCPDIFADRDRLGPRVEKTFKYINMAILPISGNRRLWVFQVNDPGLNRFDHPEFVRTLLIAFDAWLLDDKHLQEEDITLFDSKHMTLKIFWKLHLSVQKKVIRYQEEAMPIRIKQMHMVNTPPFMDKLFAIMKPFMSKEMTELLHFHVPDSDTLFQYFSKDDLPSDFGGNLDSLEIYTQKVKDIIRNHSEALKRDDLWTSPKK